MADSKFSSAWAICEKLDAVAGANPYMTTTEQAGSRMLTARQAAIRLLRWMMIGSVVLPLVLFACASWLSYRNIQSLTDNRIETRRPRWWRCNSTPTSIWCSQDILMPGGMNGLDLAREIGDDFPTFRYCSPPVTAPAPRTQCTAG